MTTRERLLAIATGAAADRCIFWPEGPWPETRVRWIAEGMAQGHDFGFDPVATRLNIDFGYKPPWDTSIIRDEGSHIVKRDAYGIVRRSSKGGRDAIAQYVSFPVSDRKSWEAIKPRLSAEAAGRYRDGWVELALRSSAEEPLTFGSGHLSGFFSFLRELFGDEEVYFLLYDDPELAREILEFQVDRLTAMLRQAVGKAHVDLVFIWEDMCYKNGPLISPSLFTDFLLEPYQRYISTAKAMGVSVFDLDSDGKVDELLPLWIEAGVNMIHPFEVQAGMDVNSVVAEYGDRLCVRGGIDKRQLARGRNAIDRELERIRPAFESGRYIPCADHSIPPDVSFGDYLYYHEKRAELVGK